MSYSAIDGDIADFLDLRGDVTEFRSELLRTFLLSEGHPEIAVMAALTDWQRDRFEKADGSWDVFRLTPAGMAAVAELRRR